jgi:hypothetical protein
VMVRIEGDSVGTADNGDVVCTDGATALLPREGIALGGLLPGEGNELGGKVACRILGEPVGMKEGRAD